MTPSPGLLAYVAAAMGIAVAGFVLIRPAPHEAEVPTPGAELAAKPEPTPQSLSSDARPNEHEGLAAARPATAPDGSAAQPRTVAPGPAPGVYAEDLVIELSELVRKGLAWEDGSAIIGVLNALAAQGEAAIPAISEYLASGEDAGFDRVEGLNPDSSLRLALFDVLRRIGGFEAEAVLLAELQVTAAPQEISTLARFLEEQAPGAFDRQAVAAARETLNLSLDDPSAPRDVGPLFQVLHDYGGADVVPEIQKHAERWGHFTTLALGELSGGEGIPALVARVERRLGSNAATPRSGHAIYSDEDLFALQMLAQVAADQPQAQSALIEQAAAGHIPDVLWPKLTQALAGVYLFQTTRHDVESVRAMDSESETHPHVRIENEQVLYIRNRFEADGLTADERVERMAMIDEVLAVTKSAQATAELQRARGALLRGVW